MEMDPQQLRQIVQEAVRDGLQPTEISFRREFGIALKAQCEKTDLQFDMTSERFAANEKALDKAEQNVDRRLKDINSGALATKTELNNAAVGLKEEIKDISCAANIREGTKRMTDWLITIIIAAIVVALFRFLGW